MVDERDKANKEVDRDIAAVEKIRARVNKREDRAAAKQKKKPVLSRRERLKKETERQAKNVVKWAMGKTKDKTIGTYKPQIQREGAGTSGYERAPVQDISDEFSEYHRNPYEFVNNDFSGTFVSNQFNDAPFSGINLDPPKATRSFRPPKF
jgi:hypothetical protein